MTITYLLLSDATAADDKSISGSSINEAEMDAQTSLLPNRDDEEILVKEMKIDGRSPSFIN